MTGPDELERYRGLLGLAEMEQLAQAVQRPLPPAIRANTLKIAVDQAARTWPERYGWRIRRVPFCATGWQIVEGDFPPSRTLEHKMGYYYIQDSASMLPVEMFRFEDGREPVILDMAASPGGKTTHLACKIGDRGLIVANDTSTSRMAGLDANIRDWGTTCVAVTNYPGERFGNWFAEAFDLVLLDAPCSGESLRAAERRKSRPVSDRERQRLHQRQVRLLTSAFLALKPGGQLVYATCTLAPEEDEAVLDALLGVYGRQATIEAVDHLLEIPAPGLASDGARAFDSRLRRAVRLWPHLYDTSGFFAALIRKREPVPVERQPSPRRSLAEAGFEAMGRYEQAGVFGGLLQTYGFDLGAVVEGQALTLWARRRRVYAIPAKLLSRFADLPCLATGMVIGEQSEGGFVPSHELVARFAAQFVDGRLPLTGEQAELWLAGRDLRGLDAVRYPRGTIVVVEDGEGRFLGRGKVLGDRLRNLLPRRLVY